MKLGHYESLNQHDLRDFFISYVGALEIPIIDYVAIGVQNTIHKTSISMMSNNDWQLAFKTLNFSDIDPIRKAAFNTRASIFAFDEVDHQDSCGKEVMRQRKRHEIENGLVFIRRHLGHNFMMTLATGFKNFKPYKFFIENEFAINKIFDDLICMTESSTKRYRVKI